jgi:phospholipase C
MRNQKLNVLLSTAAVLAAVVTVASYGPVAVAKDKTPTVTETVDALPTKYPIKHLVVIFNENESFDHYFGTYPNSLNVEGEPRFEPKASTPAVINNLLSNPTLLDNNPNLNPLNGAGATNPFRIDRTQVDTADQGHSYTPEQKAYDAGKNDLFPANTGKGGTGGGLAGSGVFSTTGQVMGYFDGNTVTALWNYAQNFAMSDNMFGDQYGPSTPGAINMFAGNTNGFIPGVGTTTALQADGQGGFTLINDVDPTYDVCSPSTSGSSTAKSIGDLLNAADIPWGSFVGGFNLQTINENGTSGCAGINSLGQSAPSNPGRSHISPVTGRTVNDYTQHHIWFQYFKSTSNPTHARPDSVASIGLTNIAGKNKLDPANHAYDLDDFQAAVDAGNFPAVSFIKMDAYQDAHPGNSNALDEQTGFVTLVNFLMQQPDWDSTAVILAYDDSDGWGDHVYATTTQGSFSAADALDGTGNCGVPGQTPEPNGIKGLPVAGRCGPGTRQPFLVISPYAKSNYVSHVQISQASIPQFIEDNWLSGKRIGGGSFDATTGSITDMFNFSQKKSVTLFLDPTSGLIDETTKIKN